MRKRKEKKEEHGMVVNKNIFMSSLKTLGTLMEVTADNLEYIHKSDIDPILKQDILHMLSEQLRGISLISQGFETSVASSGLTYTGNNSLN